MGLRDVGDDVQVNDFVDVGVLEVGGPFLAWPDAWLCAIFGGVPAEEELPRCDVCGEPLPDDDDEPGDSPWSMTGRGLYVWVRGDRVVYEEPPLCASCGMAIGMSALARWEIEEEEG